MLVEIPDGAGGTYFQCDSCAGLHGYHTDDCESKKK